MFRKLKKRTEIKKKSVVDKSSRVSASREKSHQHGRTKSENVDFFSAKIKSENREIFEKFSAVLFGTKIEDEFAGNEFAPSTDTAGLSGGRR